MTPEQVKNKFKREGKWVGAELDYLLHIPKGKTEFEIY